MRLQNELQLVRFWSVIVVLGVIMLLVGWARWAGARIAF
jgi:hypothetical protein